MTPEEIQLIAAIIQAVAAIVYMHPPEGRTPEEVQGLPFSPRQIAHFNTRLKAMGETWTFPFRRVRWW